MLLVLVLSWCDADESVRYRGLRRGGIQFAKVYLVANKRLRLLIFILSFTAVLVLSYRVLRLLSRSWPTVASRPMVHSWNLALLLR